MYAPQPSYGALLHGISSVRLRVRMVAETGIEPVYMWLWATGVRQNTTPQSKWSDQRGSDPRAQFGRLRCFHYIMVALYSERMHVRVAGRVTALWTHAGVHEGAVPLAGPG